MVFSKKERGGCKRTTKVARDEEEVELCCVGLDLVLLAWCFRRRSHEGRAVHEEMWKDFGYLLANFCPG